MKYRVDRMHKDETRVPCGMNTIRFYGDNKHKALKCFADENTGIDTWGKLNGHYGIVLSEWNHTNRDYRILKRK